MKHLSISVRGKVQGVFFRASARDRALEFGLAGWVCNQADGSVYLEVEGPDAHVDAFVAWLHEGPEYAWVDEVITAPGSLQQFQDFVIRR